MKKTRTSVSLKNKYSALKALENGSSRKDVMLKYGVKKNTICDWVKSKDRIYKLVESEACSVSKARDRTTAFDKLDAALLTWFMDVRRRAIPIGGPILFEKALQYGVSLYGSDFSPSTA